MIIDCPRHRGKGVKAQNRRICIECATAEKRRDSQLRYQKEQQKLRHIPVEGMLSVAEAKTKYEQGARLLELTVLTGLTYAMLRAEMIKIGTVFRRVGREGKNANQLHEDNKMKNHDEPMGSWNRHIARDFLSRPLRAVV